MFVKTLLNLYARGVLTDSEVGEVYDHICERVSLHGDTVDVEDLDLFERFIKNVCDIKFGDNQLVDDVPSPDLNGMSSIETNTCEVDPEPSTSNYNFVQDFTLAPDKYFNIEATPPSSTSTACSNIIGGSMDLNPIFKFFTLIGEGEKEIKKFKTMGRTMVFKFKDVDTTVNPTTWLEMVKIIKRRELKLLHPILDTRRKTRGFASEFGYQKEDLVYVIVLVDGSRN
ncbi:hypothetical protein FQR65_LT07761 [Abscondita terminalis]|nr:hypothetical protein FQR65_LT07761 [Abscondita terminalis]